MEHFLHKRKISIFENEWQVELFSDNDVSNMTEIMISFLLDRCLLHAFGKTCTSKCLRLRGREISEDFCGIFYTKLQLF